jgi:hypothetical protein
MRILGVAIIGMALVTTGSAKVSGGQSSALSQSDINRLVEQRKMGVSERQKRLIADTDKLLSLSTALKHQVDESNTEILSLDMIKKADEIEKLARSVKERIKG